MSDDTRAPRMEYPIDLDLVSATVESDAIDLATENEGRLRAERWSEHVRLCLNQWDDEDHELAAIANLPPSAARGLADALRHGWSFSHEVSDGDGWATFGWINYRGNDDSPATATVELDTLTDGTVVLTVTYWSPEGTITTEAPLEDDQVAALAAWLAYGAETAEAYEPTPTPAAALSSESASTSSGGPLSNVISLAIGMGVTIGVGVLVSNALFSRTSDMTINGEPVTAPTIPEIAGMMIALGAFALFILWAIKHAPGKFGGGRHA